MRSWMEGFQDSIDLMEQTLTDEPDIETIAGKAALSPFYYQRIFSALCNMTVGEYIRARRMTLAAQELARTDVKVIDESSDHFPNMYLLPLPMPINVTPSFSISAISFLTCCAVLPVIWRIS